MMADPLMLMERLGAHNDGEGEDLLSKCQWSV